MRLVTVSHGQPDGSLNFLIVDTDAEGNPTRKMERTEKGNYTKNAQYRWVDGKWQLYNIDENETDENGNLVMENFEDLQNGGNWLRQRVERILEYDADGNCILEIGQW